jgi:L-ascorbate metabolism protein UlaG (beta-lactamase superfamily)
MPEPFIPRRVPSFHSPMPMRATFVVLPLLITACGASAPNADTDAAKAEQDTATSATASVNVIPVQHATMVLEYDGRTVFVDPAMGADLSAYPAPDLVPITDIHPDHLDTALLRGLDLSKAALVAPKAVAELLPADMARRTSVLNNGDSALVQGFRVEAVPMYNMPDPNDPRHPKGRGNGYVVTFGKERVYISGDTEDIPEMRALKNIDMAFVCMNLPYTMTVDQAASGVLAFHPKIVYPYHYRGTEGLSDVSRFNELVKAGDPEIMVIQKDWYPAAKP